MMNEWRSIINWILSPIALLTNVNKKLKPLAPNVDQLKNLISLGLKYDKRQKKQMLTASTPKPAKKEDIDEIEALAGFSLPSDFRRFMLSQNGGIPEKSTITTSERKERVLQKIYALSSNAQNLTLLYLFSIYKNRIPRGMLPFGDDSAGNL